MILRFFAWSIQWSVATVFFVAVMAATGYFVYMEALSGGQHVTVPNIENMAVSEASMILAERGLEMGKQTPVPHQSAPKYTVVAQRPSPGRVVRTGRKVYPTVSMGADFLTAPSLIGQHLEEARAIIRKDGSRYQIDTVARIPHASPRDTVLAQDPPAGRSIPSQGKLHLLVSGGQREQGRFMPDIRGMRVDRMLERMAPFGVTLVAQEVNIPGAKADEVFDQDPPPDTLIYQGQLVTYMIKAEDETPEPATTYKGEVAHVMNYDWFDRNVRIDLIDSSGRKQTLWETSAAFDEVSKSRRAAGSTIRIPITYAQEATVEVYEDNKRVARYFLAEGNPPVSR